MKSEKIQIFQYASNPVCAPYRLENPGKLLNQRNGIKVTRFTKFNAEVYTKIADHGDLLIVQRLPMSPVVKKIFANLERLGKLIIYEIDDNLMHLDSNSEFAKQAPNDYGARIKNSILASQAVQCSTSPLAKELLKIHPEVIILENQLESIPAFSKKDFSNGSIIIGYAAGEHHLVDWLTIKDKYNETITELETLGFNLETWIIGDAAIFESLTTQNKRFFPQLPRQQYFELLKLFDISIIPLADTDFNRCKSDIKFLESAACGAAVLASSVVYSNTILHENTGLIYANAEEFARYLKELVCKPELINVLSKNAHNYVSKNRLLKQHIAKWEKAYHSWYLNRDKLLANTPVRHNLQTC